MLTLNVTTSEPTQEVSAKRKKQKLPWKERKHVLRRERKSGVVSARPSRGSGTKHAEPRSEEDNPTTPPRKRPRKQDIEDVPHTLRPEQVTEEPMYKPVMSSLFTSNPEVPKLPTFPEVQQRKDQLFASKQFADLPLAPHLIANVKQNFGFETMTRVQWLAIPHMVGGKAVRDVMVKSKTGTGKTLAYAIPVVQDLQGISPSISRVDGPYAIVVTPTRELAHQTFGVFQQLTKSFTWVVPGCIVGGEKKKSEKARLRKGLNIVIATPGRLVDHIQNTESLELSRVRWLVLDEADQLMEMGFIADINTVLEELDKQKDLLRGRRTVLLSATLNEAVRELAGRSLHNPLYIDAVAEGSEATETGIHSGKKRACDQTPSQLEQFCSVVPCKLRLVALAACLLHHCSELNQKVIVFFISRQVVEFHYHLFTETLDEDMSLYELHGSMKQDKRRDTYQKFCSATSGALLCTDVAARGLDLPEVDWIIQYSPPCQPKDYVHRVGRTARGGASGRSLLFLMPHEVELVKVLREDQGVSLATTPVEELLEYLRSTRQSKKKVEYLATDLQGEFEECVGSSGSDQEMARSAYQSFIRAYTTYAAPLKHIFHIKALHLGHTAKSFGLREAPSGLTPGLPPSTSGAQRRKHSKGGEMRGERKGVKEIFQQSGAVVSVTEYMGEAISGPRTRKRKQKH